MTLAQKLYEAGSERLPHINAVPFGQLPEWAIAYWEDVAAVAELHLAGSDVATANARVEELLDVIAGLLEHRKGIEYGVTEEQRAWRVARAVLVEAGRRVG